jgi:aminoglycoside/choline kinase family phosphotransferase
MIEAKDLEAIKKICAELKDLGYTEPKVTMFRDFNEQ